MTEEEEAHENATPKETRRLKASVLRNLPSKRDQHGNQGAASDAFLDQNAPWIAVHGSKSAVIVRDQKTVELQDFSDAEETQNGVQRTISTQEKVVAMAFSACGDYIAIADAAGTLSLYKSDGKLLFGHPVVRAGGSDSVVSIAFATSEESVSLSDVQDLIVVTLSGILLRLGELRLEEFEQLLLSKPTDALGVIMKNIRVGRKSVGWLKKKARSCVLVHRFQEEECIVTGNHGACMSVWKSSLSNQARQSEIEKVSVCDFRSLYVEAMAFDANYKLLAVLSKGKLSWWNWREMTMAFELNISGLISFAILKAFSGEEQRLQMSSLLVVARPEAEEMAPSLELIQVVHPERDGIASATVISNLQPSENIVPHAEEMHVALFVEHDQSQTLAAFRTHDGVSIMRVASGGDICSDPCKSDDGELTFDEDPATIAESLAEAPISSHLRQRSLKMLWAKIAYCTDSIGKDDDDSRFILKQLLAVAGCIREYTSSRSSPASVPANLLQWCDEISEMSYKWTTFQLLRSSLSNESGVTGNTLCEKWRLFQLSPMVEKLEEYLKSGSMRAVTIVWCRHLDDDIVCNIGTLLRYLPMSLPVSAYADWIQSEVIPVLFHHAKRRPASQADSTEKHDCQSVLSELAVWLLERSEAAATRGDLDTAIRICNLFKGEDNDGRISGDNFSFYEYMLRTDASHLKPSEYDESSDDMPTEPDALERLDSFCRKLHHIKCLAVNHQFIISFSVFEEETPASIAMSMLDRVLSPESLNKEVTDHVRKYLQFCDVDIDPVLCDYVTELAESIQTSQSAEEIRALVLLDEISNANIRVDATLALLRSALPPYSPALKSYAHNCARSWKADRLEEIQEHVRLMEIQDMLTGYDIRQFDIADAKSASRMVSHILNQVSRPTAFTDAMLLVDAYSDLHCDRAVVMFTENLLADSGWEDLDEVDPRVKRAIAAFAEVKKRKDIKSNAMQIVSLMEEIIEFGVTLLEMEVEEQDGSCRDEQAELRSKNSHCFELHMLAAIVAAYIPELKTVLDLAGASQNEPLAAYVSSSAFLLSDALLMDLHRICRIEADYGMLLSVSTLRDSERCERKVKELMLPNVLFADGNGTTYDGCTHQPRIVPSVTFIGKGKGKKRAVDTGEPNSSASTKRHRSDKSLNPRAQIPVRCEDQRDDSRTRLIFDLNRLASAVGIDSKACQALIAHNAAQNGSILQAVRFSRDLFARRAIIRIDGGANLLLERSTETDSMSKLHAADTLKKIAISLSFYTSAHAKEIYGVPFTRNQPLKPAFVARIQAPMYTLELLKYALCMCDEDSFDETLVLLKNTMLVNEVLQHTQHDVMVAKQGGAQWKLYPRWYRGDSCVFSSYDVMKLATRFAIAEHKNLRREVEARDTIASKRYVSFLVEQRADSLSLQVLLSMHELPEDAATVVNTQMGKLLSTVFQSQEIDNYLALGLMLSMEKKDSFNAFRRQISRENVAKDFNRFQRLALIGADTARAWQQIAFLHQCVELEGNARWWHYLNLLGIECDHKAFQSDRRDLEYIRQLVPTLITRSNYDFYTVLEFTRHYQIDDNFPSLVYAETLLLEKSATNGLEYQDKIAGVIEDIHEQHLEKMLLKSIPKIAGQDYDRLLFIFRLLLEHTSYAEPEEVQRRVEVLRNLKTFAAFQVYDCVKAGRSMQPSGGANSPNEFKRSYEAKTEHVSFHKVIAKPREVLARLVTKENFSSLIGLAEPLRLEPDELQMMLLKNMITRNRKNIIGIGEGSSNSPVQFSAFEDILSCLSDTESRVTAAEWLAENFPLGEEKLKALQFALSAAVSGGNGGEDPYNTSFTGHEALTRLETKILRVKLEQLLRDASSQTSSLANLVKDAKQMDQLLALVSEPEKLFLELYRRYALWFYAHSSDKLHTVATSIAELLQLPQTKLHVDLVREWLLKDAVQMGQCTTDEGNEDPFELLEVEKLQRADDDFGNRILYIASTSVRRGDALGEQVMNYLFEFANDSQPRAGVTFRAKMRALRVILRLGQLYHGAVDQYVSTKYGLESTDAFFKELLEYTKHCTHMVTFEEHRVPYEMSFVMKTDKEVLVRSFLRRFSLNNPWVLRCASHLLLDFEVGVSDLWEDILSNMLKLGMVRSLVNILGPLSRKSFVRSLACGRQVWEEVLTLPLIHLKDMYNKYVMVAQDNSSTVPTSGEMLESLLFAGISIPNVKSVLAKMGSLLQRCPFLDQIDVPAFVIHLRDLTEMAEGEPDGLEVVRQMNFYGFAVKCAMIIPKPVTRFEALVRIIRSGAFGSVLHELLDTSCFIVGEQSEKIAEDDTGDVADCLRLIQESFAEAAKRKDYAAILDTPFEQGFVEYLAATADIDYLLSLLLEGKRMETALTAVELFYEYHPTAAPSLDAKNSPDENEIQDPARRRRLALLDAYVASSTSAYLARFKVACQ